MHGQRYDRDDLLGKLEDLQHDFDGCGARVEYLLDDAIKELRDGKRGLENTCEARSALNGLRRMVEDSLKLLEALSVDVDD